MRNVLHVSAGVHPRSPGLWRGAGRRSWHRQLLGISELSGSGIRQLRRHHAFPRHGWVFLSCLPACPGHGWVFCHVAMPFPVMGGSSVVSSCLSWSWVGRHAFLVTGGSFVVSPCLFLVTGDGSCYRACPGHGRVFLSCHHAFPGHGWVYCCIV